MFYIKENEKEIELTSEAFTRCPDCGAEFEVDLSELIREPYFDFYGTSVFCDKCSAKRAKR